MGLANKDMRSLKLARYSTAHLPSAQQFDFWQSLFQNIGLEPLDGRMDNEIYDAEALSGSGPNGIDFGTSKSANTRAHFGGTTHDNVLLSLTLSGSVTILDKSGSSKSVTADSGPVLIDTGRPLSIITRAEHKHTYLSIPRKLVLPSGTRDPFETFPAIDLPSTSPLTSMLSANLRMMDEQAPRLSCDEADLVIGQLADLAVACMDFSSVLRDAPDSKASRISFLAACDHMDRHLSYSDLTADTVAAALGFSRAHLYRVFASQDETVVGLLRTRRLDKARELLGRGGARNIDAIAFAVGYQSAVAFSRAFKKRFGLSPRDYRALLAGH